MMDINIPPVVSQWISVGITVAGGIAAMSPSIVPDYIPPGYAKAIIQTAGICFFVGGLFQTALHRYSSSDPGPGATPDPPEVKRAMLKAQEIEINKNLVSVPQGSSPPPFERRP